MRKIIEKPFIGIVVGPAAIAVLFCFNACFWHRSNQHAVSGPFLRVANNKVDLGRLPPSTVQEATFTIENRGSRRLILNEINCGCDGRARDAILIPPGTLGQVTVDLETHFDSGEIEKTVRFSTNDAMQPQIELTAVAHVVAN